MIKINEYHLKHYFLKRKSDKCTRKELQIFIKNSTGVKMIFIFYLNETVALKNF